MIRLGIDAAGNSVTGPYDIAGYAETGGSNNLYHNTIYIGGSSGTSNAFTNALLNWSPSTPETLLITLLSTIARFQAVAEQISQLLLQEVHLILRI